MLLSGEFRDAVSEGFRADEALFCSQGISSLPSYNM